MTAINVFSVFAKTLSVTKLKTTAEFWVSRSKCLFVTTEKHAFASADPKLCSSLQLCHWQCFGKNWKHIYFGSHIRPTVNRMFVILRYFISDNTDNTAVVILDCGSHSVFSRIKCFHQLCEVAANCIVGIVSSSGRICTAEKWICEAQERHWTANTDVYGMWILLHCVTLLLIYLYYSLQ